MDWTANCAVSLVIADADEAGVGRHVVDAVRHDLAQVLVLEVVHLDAQRIALRPIVGATILEVADQLFLLRIDGDDGLAFGLSGHDFRIDVVELRVTVRVLRAFLSLAIVLAREAELHQFLAHRIGADRMPHGGQDRGQFVHALRHPQQRAHGIAERGRFEEALQCRHETGISRGDSLAAGAGTPHLTFRQFLAASRSSSPRLMVERASPVIRETTASPPRPAVLTSPAANIRRPRSSSFEPTMSQR